MEKVTDQTNMTINSVVIFSNLIVNPFSGELQPEAWSRQTFPDAECWCSSRPLQQLSLVPACSRGIFDFPVCIISKWKSISKHSLLLQNLSVTRAKLCSKHKPRTAQKARFSRQPSLCLHNYACCFWGSNRQSISEHFLNLLECFCIN